MRKWNNHWALMITFFSFLFLLLAVFDCLCRMKLSIISFQCKTNYTFFFRSQYCWSFYFTLPQETFHYISISKFLHSYRQLVINQSYIFIHQSCLKEVLREREEEKKAIVWYNVAVGLDFSFDEHSSFFILLIFCYSNKIFIKT